MKKQFTGPVIEWRGPAPYYFIETPPEISDEIAHIAPLVTYGWGAVPATITIGSVVFTTALFPKKNAYFIPLKKSVREKEKVDAGDMVELSIEIPLVEQHQAPGHKATNNDHRPNS